jgi:hypothetical protein
METIVAAETYPVRTTTALFVRDELMQEQVDRAKGGGARLTLMQIAGEWLEQMAEQKREKRG